MVIIEIEMIGSLIYTVCSTAATGGVIYNAIQKQETFFNTVVFLTSQKVNLLIFFNFLVVVFMNIGNFLVWIFFDKIRSIESKVLSSILQLCSISWTRARKRYSTSFYLH